MTSPVPKSPADVQGMEYDWLGSDSTGCIALFSTAGAGYAPAEFLRDTDAHDIAIRAVLALPPTTRARFFPSVGAGLDNTWRLVAERGLYAYDFDPAGGPYRLVAAPVAAANAHALPPAVTAVATQIRCRGQFEGQDAVTEEMLAARLDESQSGRAGWLRPGSRLPTSTPAGRTRSGAEPSLRPGPAPLLQSDGAGIADWVETGARLFVLNAEVSVVRHALTLAAGRGGNGWESYWLARVAFFWEADSESALLRVDEALGVLGDEPATLALRAGVLEDLQASPAECCATWARAYTLAPCWPSVAYGYGQALLRESRASEFLEVIAASDRLAGNNPAESSEDNEDALSAYCRNVIVGCRWAESRARLLQLAPVSLRTEVLRRG